MELFLNTIQTGWATDGIYTLIQRSAITPGITKNAERTSSLSYINLRGKNKSKMWKWETPKYSFQRWPNGSLLTEVLHHDQTPACIFRLPSFLFWRTPGKQTT